MINLKNYILESIFDVEYNIDNVDESIKDQIKQFLNNNFKNASKCIISEKPNKDGKFEVSSNGDISIKNEHITSPTNGLFIWTNIKGNFICSVCDSLISLEGAPKKVGGGFYCNSCNSLKSLKGAPKEVGGDFYCRSCKGEFIEEDVKKVSNVKGIPRSSFWEAYSIKKYEFVNSKYNLPKKVDDKKIEFMEDHAFFSSQFKKSQFSSQTIYELPDTYISALNLFKK